MVKFLGTYNVIPSLPASLEKLREIAFNLHWTWNPDSRDLFRRVDSELWEETNHNPIMLLGNTSQQRLEELSHEDGFKSHLHRVHNNLRTYLEEKTWFDKSYSNLTDLNIAYFSAEFGLTECLQTYSGGLGVLAGDHLKAASDLGIPLIGVGILYKVGYFQQYLTSDGWQHERYEINDFDNQPMKQVLNDKNEPLILSVNMMGREVYFQIWKIQVGRIPLYLLDTNVSKNNDADKKITESLYGGGVETRIQQEIILGIGGIRALHALGIYHMVCHMNEGHSAFLSLERTRILIEQHGLSFREAKDIGYFSNIFTTHTPVPAGIDVFSNELVEKYFSNYYRNELHISDKEFYALGTIYKEKESNVFNMAHLAMNTAGFINGVSKLHGDVSKKMWVSGFKNVPFNEIPIGHITNGVHIRSHISSEMETLFNQYIGEKWVHNPASGDLWNRIDKIPDEELWRTHERRRERLVAFARKRLTKQLKAKGEGFSEIAAATEVLDPTVLTIGFARRFATYKRATLIFRDIERLSAIVNSKDHPVQFVIAGKAHPKDEEGKRFIQEIYKISKDERFKRKIVFIENYDLNVARYLVEGCDVWLNNPRRPLEASGTSGMKVIANGGLNFSVLDGWWDEGFDPSVGWKIGNGEEYTDPDYQDEIESRQFYDTLERQIIPQFYHRTEDRLPRGWITMIKNSMKKLGPFFNTHRMVEEYFTKYYLAAQSKRKFLMESNWNNAKNYSKWKEKEIQNWSGIRIDNIKTNNNAHTLQVGEEYHVNADVHLGKLSPEDVEVQLYYGPLEKQDQPQFNNTVVMESENKTSKEGNYKYSGSIRSNNTGSIGYTIRILPKNSVFIHPYESGIIYWAE